MCVCVCACVCVCVCFVHHIIPILPFLLLHNFEDSYITVLFIIFIQHFRIMNCMCANFWLLLPSQLLKDFSICPCCCYTALLSEILGQSFCPQSKKYRNWYLSSDFIASCKVGYDIIGWVFSPPTQAWNKNKNKLILEAEKIREYFFFFFEYLLINFYFIASNHATPLSV